MADAVFVTNMKLQVFGDMLSLLQAKAHPNNEKVSYLRDPELTFEDVQHYPLILTHRDSPGLALTATFHCLSCDVDSISGILSLNTEQITEMLKPFSVAVRRRQRNTHSCFFGTGTKYATLSRIGRNTQFIQVQVQPRVNLRVLQGAGKSK